ncbi:hypothetical protein cyc_07365 [Cyclospora cayetanensis]|uniref:Transmembrane protein n=1 Tax=Cyclospora cayetanensis TaxID=88456 RepID=A0A1D3CZA3_9EIME|nr:hypothetical protein cyc_07365 [Cyclospora cayetanensis]
MGGPLQGAPSPPTNAEDAFPAAAAAGAGIQAKRAAPSGGDELKNSPQETLLAAGRGLLGGLGGGTLYAAVQSVRHKRHPAAFMFGACGAFLGVMALTTTLTLRSQKKHKKGLVSASRKPSPALGEIAHSQDSREGANPKAMRRGP